MGHAVVIYIGGAPRSGTTLLGQLLTANSNATFVGEVKSTLLESDDSSLCDCGAPRSTCPVWSTLSGAGRIERDHAAAAYKLARAGRLWMPGRRDAAAASLLHTLRTLRAATTTRYLVDSSKTVTGAVAWQAAGQTVHLVHVIRHPSEVARRQSDERTSPTGRAVAPAKTYLDFGVQTTALSAIRARMNSYTLVRFEQLIADPTATLARIWRAVGDQPAAPARTVEIGTSHVVRGNPRRAHTGRLTVHEDGEA